MIYLGILQEFFNVLDVLIELGTKHKNIYIYNFFPTSETDVHLGLENSVKAKIQAFLETLGEDSKYLSDEEETINHKLFGDRLFDKLNNKDTYNEDDVEENIELKSLEIMKNIRDNDTELFNKIKRLPKKARTAKTIDIKNNSLISFFKKGKLKKLYYTDGVLSPEDIGFDDAIRFFECEKDCKKMPVPKDYYSYLNKNKEAFLEPEETEAIQLKKKGGASNDNMSFGRMTMPFRG